MGGPCGLRTKKSAERERRILELRAERTSVRRIAERLRISRRTVYRALAKARAALEAAR